MRHLREQWRRTASPSWRALQTGPFWLQHDAVIAYDTGSRSTRGYDVYTYGTQIARRHTIEDAKAVVEEVYGPLEWHRIRPEKQTAVHYYYGETDEFSDPTTLLVVDSLPRLGSLTSGIAAFGPWFHASRHERIEGEIFEGPAAATVEAASDSRDTHVYEVEPIDVRWDTGGSGSIVGRLRVVQEMVDSLPRVQANSMLYYSDEWKAQAALDAKAGGGRFSHPLTKKTNMGVVKRLAEKVLRGEGITLPLDIAEGTAWGTADAEVVDGVARLRFAGDQKTRWNAIHEAAHIILDVQAKDDWERMLNADHGQDFRRLVESLLAKYGGEVVSI